MGGIVEGIFGFLGAKEQASATESAAQKSADASRYATDLQKQMWQQQVETQKPWVTAGTGAVNQLAASLAPGGQYATPFSQTNWQQDPGYQFRLSEGLKAIDQQAAARGGLISGAALKAAQRYGQDMASQEYQNAFNRYYTERTNMLNPLQSLAGLGQTSANQVGAMGSQYGANVGNLTMTNAANQANAGLAASNVRASQYGQIGKALGNTNWNQVGNWLTGSGGTTGTYSSPESWDYMSPSSWPTGG